MMNDLSHMPDEEKGLKAWFLQFHVLFYAGWTLTALVSLSWSFYFINKQVVVEALASAESAFNRVVTYRQWATMHGGVYVPETNETPANPYLAHVEERDIATPSGRKLTLMNPSYMTRQALEIGSDKYGLHGHITSLNPLRASNSPDPWEREALLSFKQREDSYWKIEFREGKKHLNFMRPLIIDQGCLKCHGNQGYELGDIGGGISISVPVDQFKESQQAFSLATGGAHFLFWMIGIIIFRLSRSRIARLEDVKQIREGQLRRLQATALQESEDANRTMIELLEQKEKTEGDLSEVAERLSLATKAAGVGIWDLNTKNEKLVWDDSMFRIYKANRDDFQGNFTDWEKSVHKEDIKRVESELVAALSGKEEFDTEFRIVWPDGSIRIIRAIAAIHRDEEGSPLRVVGVNWDVTRYRKTEANYQQVLHSSIDGFLITNLSGTILEANQALCDTVHCTRDCFISRNIRELADGDGVELLNEHLSSIYTEVHSQFSMKLRCKDGPSRDVQIKLQFVNHSGERIFVFVQDISEQMKAQEELNKQLDELRRWHEVTLGREERVNELKAEVNDLLLESGKDSKYHW